MVAAHCLFSTIASTTPGRPTTGRPWERCSARYAFRSAELTLRLLIAVRLNRPRFYSNDSVHTDLHMGQEQVFFREVI
jgi:hypothetical protein